MTARREFPDRIRLQILKRAMDANGRVRCEGCGGVLKAKEYEFDHRIAEALVVDKSRPLTADDGQLLGYCCHRGEDGKTNDDVARIAKAKRQERGQLGLRRTSRPMPGSKASGLRKRMNGKVEKRT